MLHSGTPRLSASFPQEDRHRKSICVYDCRSPNRRTVPEKWLDTTGLDFNDFLQVVQKEFAIRSHETFVLTTTDRTVLDYDKFEELQDRSTVHMLQQEDQALSVATKEHITFTPHHNTLTGSGMYEYYASEGQKPLSYALAELVDNALSATAKNPGMRTIEIRMLFDETLGKPAVIILDNGCGMTSKQLNNWAVYRLSKFTRANNKFESQEEGYVRPDPVPRSLNSDISYFGAGGKQAVFYIGDTTRMISKPVNSQDVHELVLSKEEFERKEKNREEVYTGTIINRKPGDSSHVNGNDERFLRAIIAEECGKESFTAVVITGILPEHITFLKQDFEVWTRELAHIYHYYIHGINGNIFTNPGPRPEIDIQITLREKSPRCPRAINLREVDDDMQTLYINSAKDTFEFKASTKDSGIVEGVMRYHPFLFDRETYPTDPLAVQDADDDDDDYDNESGELHQARGKRPIFECFWNGRCIPYTAVSEFDWCSRGKGAKLPAECYRRVSGLTFMDLELKLKEKDTIFTRVVNGQKQRGNIQKEFTQWLQSCHEKWDKQIKFLGYKSTVTRTDVPTKKMQQPWGTFSSIEWDGKKYKTGQLMRSQKTLPILYGTVVQFFLFGNYKGDVFATGGQVEVSLEPRALHGKTKIIPISKIDKTATDEAIKKNIEIASAKLPEKLKVHWPDSNPWPQNAVRPAGTLLGPVKVEILNRNGDSLSRMPSVGQGQGKKLVVQLKIVQHVTNSISPSKVKKTKKKKNLTVKFVILPEYLNYTLVLFLSSSEGSAVSFVIGSVSPSLSVGVPFDIPLLIKDGYGHPAMPPPNLTPLLQCNPHSLHVTPEDNPMTVENGNPVRFNVEIHDEAGNITAHTKQIVRCEVEGLPLVSTDCSSTGAGQLVTKPIKLKIIKQEPQTLRVKFEMPVSKNKQSRILSGSNIYHNNLVLRNEEKIEWLAGGLMENLFYRLYDEAGREVPLTTEIASKIKVCLAYIMHCLFLFTVSYSIKKMWFCKCQSHFSHLERFKWFGCVIINKTNHFAAINFHHSGVYLNSSQFFADFSLLTLAFVDADGLVKSAVFTWQKSSDSVLVTGVQFQSGTPGSREICFTYRSYVERVKVDVNAGVPAQLKLVSEPEKPLRVLNDHGIPTPFLVQLCDKWGNPSPDQRVVVELKSTFPILSQPSLVRVLFPCSSTRGYYQLEFKGSLNMKPIPGPSVILTVIPDPNKPVSLSVVYDTSARFPAGDKFPAFSVTVVSDEGSPITTFNPAAVTMFLWKGGPVVENYSLLRKVNMVFVFFLCRDKEIPEDAGKHIIQFSLRVNKTKVLFSDQITINVEPNQPVKLRPDSQPPAPVVSYSKDIARRTLVENMTLRIMDLHGNPTGQDLNGKVKVSITTSSGDNNNNNNKLPLFEGSVNSFQFSLVEGKAHISRLAVMENSPGEDGTLYILLFKPEVSSASTSLDPFELIFYFCNDINRMLEEKSAEANRILNMPRRVCSIPDHFKGQQDVLGMVGHLAFVQDSDAARVISWHIRGDMDCVITKTTAAARRIYDYTQGRQQVMALDSVYVPPGDRPLPHIRNGHMLFDPPGNPIYARTLLIYPQDQEYCNTVFKNLLGDTILIDDLDSANNYRKAVVQNKTQCPTILTRQGDRISSRGKFGGAQNKAPPINTLQVFGAPCPQEYYTLKGQIGDLSHYRLTLQKKERSAKDREEHLQNMSSPETKKNQQEMQAKQRQLEEIESKTNKTGSRECWRAIRHHSKERKTEFHIRRGRL
uniref:Structural maintenance of chromosomes flexible hinge domain containing 1 n=1 Tax=Dicentrarchus labrax TaxID=13489 RepID=A0A8C4HNU0_DICLA